MVRKTKGADWHDALASLSESARKVALDRFRLLQPHLEQQRLLNLVARDAGIAYRTAQRRMSALRATDWAIFVRNLCIGTGRILQPGSRHFSQFQSQTGRTSR
jgi:putative transposase